MPSMTIKNIPEDLYQKLKSSAVANHRSLNGELIRILEERLCPKKLTAEEWIFRARKLREGVPAGKVSSEEISSAIEEGRP